MDLTPQPHWGLGLPLYTLASSPIRRCLDLVIHRQILGALAGSGPVYGEKELEQLLLVMEPDMRQALFLKTMRLRYWLLKYLAQEMGKKMEALVVDSLDHRYRLL